MYALNQDKEIVKTRKIYFLDNGLVSSFADIGSVAKFENTVFNQLHHFGELNYYQLKTGQEIDFILNKTIAFEVKETVYKSDYLKMIRLAKNINIEKGTVIYKNQNINTEHSIWAGFIR